jgi:fatty-acyl-CoA synthase
MHANHEIIRRVLDALRGDDDVSSLRMINCGSGIAGLMERAAGRNVSLRSIYGSSEMQARYAQQTDELPLARRIEGGGFPLSPRAEVQVADIETGRLLPSGEKGELLLRGPSQLREYFGDAKATARAITADGFVRTGDCGYQRNDGSFVLEARIGDVLKLSGFMVSPAEIECLLMTYPGVAQCSVVGAQGSRGAVAVAFVRGAPVDEAAMQAWCRERIAHYKVPARIVCLDEFPTTAGANAPKVQKARLRELAAGLKL